ncbi:MAG: hypothetical protein ACRDTF_21555 [Pseudonocardiaceae bacterium]
MLTGAAQPHDPEPGDDDQHEAVDPATLAPLCGAAEFTELVDEMVADEAPRLFAVVQEYGTRVDGRIAAWGMAFEDHAEVVAVEGGLRMSLSSPQRAIRLFGRRPHITTRVVWVKPDTATRSEDDAAA